MRYIVLLSGENLELAKEEALALAKTKKHKQQKNLLVVESEKFPYERMAYAHKVCRYIFCCDKKNLKRIIKSTNWQKHYKKDFSITTHNTELNEIEIAGLIWDKIKNPKVNLLYAKSKFLFFQKGRKVYCGLQLWENGEDFNSRKAHKRPGFSPISMHPKLARCLVNLSRAEKSILDPFCGTGGLLIEAGLMGIKPIGTDIDAKMLEKAKKNLEHFRIKNYLLKKADAKNVDYKAEAIATDPPYGHASSLSKGLLKDFLENAYKILPKKAYLVMILPNNKRIKSKFKIKKKIKMYIHKSLTRTIHIMQK